MNCQVCGKAFHASEGAKIKQKVNDTVFIATQCPVCKVEYSCHNHFGEWMVVAKKKLPPNWEESLNHGE